MLRKYCPIPVVLSLLESTNCPLRFASTPVAESERIQMRNGTSEQLQNRKRDNESDYGDV
jgi:hypothetical protein